MVIYIYYVALQFPLVSLTHSAAMMSAVNKNIEEEMSLP